MTTQTVDVVARYQGVVIGARVGDAMGTPTEGLSAVEINSRFGWVTEFEGDGTDDSLMADILAAALIESKGFAGSDEWAGQLVAHYEQIVAKRDFFFASVLHLLDKLRRGYRPAEVALGNMPSSSSAMCIWPVALVNPANPRAAAAQAYELASLIQVAPVDHCADAAAVLAAVIASAVSPGATARSAIDDALECIRPTSGQAFRDAVVAAVDLAESSGTYDEFRESFQRRFSRPIMCDALETVPAALALVVLAEGDVTTAVEYGANFGRDSDTIACMAGAFAGALSEGVPSAWLEALGPDATSSARKLAADLAATAGERNSEERARLLATAEFLGS